ncbi:MAG TPA: hypothetical protein VJ761_22695 [Ktedonobacteraceae bacterium]|nr:hypothetical protein [Ktedonobacteraceae bacterium]
MKKLILIGGGTLLLLGAMVAGAFLAMPLFASAQSKTLTAAPATSAATNPYCEQYLQDLANRLHVSVSTLQGDKLAAAKDVIAQMVKDGKLTQSEANTIEQRLSNHQACTGNGPVRVGNRLVLHALKSYLPDIENQVAQGLHLTSAQLTAQLQSGKSLSDIATAQHVTASQLHTIVVNAIQSALNKAVAAGNLTQQQATTFMQKLQSHPQILNRILHAHHKKA